MKGKRASHSIRTLCRVLGVSPSGYHAWCGRAPGQRARRDEVLTERIRTFHQISRGTYGAPRLHKDLMEDDIRVGKRRVARLMRQAGLRGVCRRKGFRTTVRGDGPTAWDLVKREFVAEGPNRLWVADITYVPTQ